jgi:hypothetical protein
MVAQVEHSLAWLEQFGALVGLATGIFILINRLLQCSGRCCRKAVPSSCSELMNKQLGGSVPVEVRDTADCFWATQAGRAPAMA